MLTLPASRAHCSDPSLCFWCLWSQWRMNRACPSFPLKTNTHTENKVFTESPPSPPSSGEKPRRFVWLTLAYLRWPSSHTWTPNWVDWRPPCCRPAPGSGTGPGAPGLSARGMMCFCSGLPVQSSWPPRPAPPASPPRCSPTPLCLRRSSDPSRTEPGTGWTAGRPLDVTQVDLAGLRSNHIQTAIRHEKKWLWGVSKLIYWIKEKMNLFLPHACTHRHTHTKLSIKKSSSLWCHKRHWHVSFYWPQP